MCANLSYRHRGTNDESGMITKTGNVPKREETDTKVNQKSERKPKKKRAVGCEQERKFSMTHEKSKTH